MKALILKFIAKLKLGYPHLPLRRGSLIALLSILSLISLQSYATDYYIDQSCSVAGDGATDQCATTVGATGAFKGVQPCFDVVTAGETCFIKNGTYVTTNPGTAPRFNGGFVLKQSGTLGNPITIKNYPGHSPFLANCTAAVSTTRCTHPTITTPYGNYIVIDGLRVQGGISIFGGNGRANPSFGNVIKNSEITVGWGGVGDGNWSALFLSDQTGFLVQGNYIHDIEVASDGGQQSSGGCIKMYHHTDSIIEYNTCKDVRIPETQAGGIDDKAQAVRNIHRFNYIENVNVGIRINNQYQSSGVKIYGNVLLPYRAGIRLLTRINGIDVFNNTIYGGAKGTTQSYDPDAPDSIINARLYNNIINNVTEMNIEWYSNPAESNYNTFTANKPYRIAFAAGSSAGANYFSLADYQAAKGFDAQSTETACDFVNSAQKDFHLTATSSCKGLGRVGGVATGNQIDLGAYGVTSCVGHTCVASDKGKVPNPPTNLIINL